MKTEPNVKVCSLDELERDGVRTLAAEGHVIAAFYHGDQVYALDNRCPHMGFPLHRGTVKDGILTCHWHHAKFDLASGCTFDLFADDAPRFHVEVRDGYVWVDPQPIEPDPLQRWLRKLDEGLEHGLRLVMAKAVIGLDELGGTIDLLEKAALFGIRNRADGWSPGLTVLTTVANVLPSLAPEDRRLALLRGLERVQAETEGNPPNFDVGPLAVAEGSPEEYPRWFRRFIEVRSEEAAERTLRTAIRAGLPEGDVADMVFAACTDHLFRGTGHVLDFANKAFELLDHIGWRYAEDVLPSVIHPLADWERMEETSQWRHPVDVASLLFETYAELDALIEEGEERLDGWDGHGELAEQILVGEAPDTLAQMRDLVRKGVPLVELSSTVAYAGARRFVHYPTSNEIPDWDTVHNTFTYCNAVDRAMRRAPSRLLARGIFDGAMAVYLDRFLNVPRRPIPKPSGRTPSDGEFLAIFDHQGSVEEAGQAVVDLVAAGRREDLPRLLGHVMLREDGVFHEFQAYEAGLQQFRTFAGKPEGDHVLVGVARLLASKFPTRREANQTFDIAMRLQRGEKLYGEEFEE